MGNKEVDFVLDESFQSKITLINVCYDITNPLTARREIESLVEGMKELKIKASLLLTNYQQGEEKIDGMWIKIVPAWKWLLNL
jgi:predicted AAA+ superfamily ATPase